MSLHIGVIGTFIRDTIITLDNREVVSIGGLYHTLAYLASLVTGETTVWPLCNVGADFYEAVTTALSSFGTHLRFDLMRQVPVPNTQVTLVYRSAETRDEFTTAPMAAIGADEVPALAHVDAVLINMITGEDVELAALQTLRAQPQPPTIYLDLHSLALGIDANGKRYYRRSPDWQQWVTSVDILQLNEREAATLAGLEEDPADSDLVAFGERLVASGLLACHLTLASRGSLLCYRDGDRIRHEFFKPLTTFYPVDIIGCGDAFGAAFLTSWLKGVDLRMATQFANNVAALNTSFMGSLTPDSYERHVKPYLS